jgi:methionyl-tRNA formyltransferase
VAFTYYNAKLLKVFKAKISGLSFDLTSVSPGEVVAVSGEGIVVATDEGNIILEELQIEGKRRMSAKEFIAGYRIKKGDKFSKK